MFQPRTLAATLVLGVLAVFLFLLYANTFMFF